MKISVLYIGLAFLFLSFDSFAQCFTTVHTRYNHTVALKPDGSIWGWGWGVWGNLNNTTEMNEYVPVQIAPNAGWLEVKGGSYNTFAIHSDGTLWGCGNNESGNLGVGYVSEYIPVLTQIGSEANWRHVAPSNDFTVALKTDNTLWTWGLNMYHQLGDGTTIQRNSPVQISPDTDWKMVGSSTAGASFAVKYNGTLWCWGSNIAGLLGSNLLSHRSVPTLHNTDTDWDTIAVGTAHILALKMDGTLWSWGGGDSGETGDGLPQNYNRFEPHQVGTDADWVAIAAGERFSFGIKSDGTLWAWGKNDVGQLGDGTAVNRPLPVQIGNDTNWASITAGFQHAVALKTDGSLWAWGGNGAGQLGNGTIDPVLSPINITVDGCTLAVADVEDSPRVIIYPNPARDRVTISGRPGFTATLFDMAGRSLGSYSLGDTGEAHVSVEDYPAGVYLVVVLSENGIITQKKLVIE